MRKFLAELKPYFVDSQIGSHSFQAFQKCYSEHTKFVSLSYEKSVSQQHVIRSKKNDFCQNPFPSGEVLFQFYSQYLWFGAGCNKL